MVQWFSSCVDRCRYNKECTSSHRLFICLLLYFFMFYFIITAGGELTFDRKTNCTVDFCCRVCLFMFERKNLWYFIKLIFSYLQVFRLKLRLIPDSKYTLNWFPLQRTSYICTNSNCPDEKYASHFLIHLLQLCDISPHQMRIREARS